MVDGMMLRMMITLSENQREGVKVHTGVIDQILQVMLFISQYKQDKKFSSNTFLADEQQGVLDLTNSIELIVPLNVAGEKPSAGVRQEAGEPWGQPAGQGY